MDVGANKGPAGTIVQVLEGQELPRGEGDRCRGMAKRFEVGKGDLHEAAHGMACERRWVRSTPLIEVIDSSNSDAFPL